MKLPNGYKAFLGDKLDRDSLNPDHPKGKDKATMFKNRLGITLTNKEVLERALLNSAINNDAIIYKIDRYGTQYDIKFLMTTDVGTSFVLGCWIVRHDEDFPRLTNAYPVDK